jgi:hypothetical protein
MWQEIIEHFQTLEERPVERMAFLVGGLLLFWIFEGAIPLIQPKYKKINSGMPRLILGSQLFI